MEERDESIERVRKQSVAQTARNFVVGCLYITLACALVWGLGAAFMAVFPGFFHPALVIPYFFKVIAGAATAIIGIGALLAVFMLIESIGAWVMKDMRDD